VLVDLPGVGEAPPPEDPRADALLDAVADVIDAVSPAQPVVLVGHSLGGAIAARLTARLPGRVRALVLVAAPVAPFRLGRERLLLHVSLWPPLLHLAGATAGVGLGLQRVSGGGDRAGALDVALIARTWSDRRQRSAIAAHYAAFLEPSAILVAGAALDTIHVPVLLIWGEDDRLVPLDVARVAAARLARVTTVQTHLIAGAGHLPPLARPRETAVALEAFLDTLSNNEIESNSDRAGAPRLRVETAALHSRDLVWSARRELFPLLGFNALFPLDGRADLSLVAGVARGGVDLHFPVEAGRLAFTAGATLRVSSGAAAFAYLRATARLELVWRWVGGFHVDGTLLVDPRTGTVGGYGALGYAASALPWTRLFVAGGALPGEAARVFIGVEIDARLTGWLY
jgi:pimeloyl-ACP methyl ester carboxylesterase